ncbi:hypothetical protein LCGC14_1026850 [marine sediment metagenome]|uniref:Uncharacterized protein n=1 Tax=marine sediment metagenome TaxID=412755 RepID=A0A0F9R1Q5_9ZZZZ
MNFKCYNCNAPLKWNRRGNGYWQHKPDKKDKNRNCFNPEPLSNIKKSKQGSEKE